MLAIIFCPSPASEAAALNPPPAHLSFSPALPAHWSQPVSITHQAHAFQPLVAMAGQSVFMAWQEYNPTLGSPYYLAYSPDGGHTWGAKWPVTFVPPIDYYGIYPHTLAVDPQSKALYLGYIAGEAESGPWYFVTRSLDGGRTWTEVPVPEIRDTFVSLTLDQSGRLYLGWGWGYGDFHLASSGNGGQSWETLILPDDDLVSYTGIAASGNGRIFLLRQNSLSGQWWLSRSDDAGQSWTNLTPPDELLNASSVGIVAAGPEEMYLMGQIPQAETMEVWLAASQDGGLSWGAPTQAALLTDGYYPQVAARGQGRLAALWQAGTVMYLAESENAGQSWSEADLLAEDVFLVTPTLLADPTSGNVLVTWNEGDGQIWVSTSTTAAPANCPAVELLSARRLNEQTIGVVGLLDLNLGITSASLTAEGATSVDILTLAQQNAPSGGDNPSGEQRWSGLWSASLYNPNGFGSTVSVGVEVIVSTIPDCFEPSLTAPAASPVHIQSIRANGANPDQDGVAVKVATSDGSLPTVVLSRYQAGETGLNGAWQPILTTALQADGNLFVPGEFVAEGENLYRVMVDGQPGVEDVDGFFAVAQDTSLFIEGESPQYRQALVFRDAVRAVRNENPPYANRFPEPLLVAIGAAETGGATQTTLGFDNTGDGIMQVTCGSGSDGYRGYSAGENCPNSYSYPSTAQGIEFNLQDALKTLNDKFAQAEANRANPSKHYYIPDMNDPEQEDFDLLMTSLVYYNGGGDYVERYQSPADDGGVQDYLARLSCQLLPTADRGSNLPDNQSVAEFLADADYAATVIPDLIERLEFGQGDVDNSVGRPAPSYCQ